MTETTKPQPTLEHQCAIIAALVSRVDAENRVKQANEAIGHSLLDAGVSSVEEMHEIAEGDPVAEDGLGLFENDCIIAANEAQAMQEATIAIQQGFELLLHQTEIEVEAAKLAQGGQTTMVLSG